MSGPWEQYVEPAAEAMWESFRPGVWPRGDGILEPIPAWSDCAEEERESCRDEVRAALGVIGPKIVEDTTQRLIEAAARAVERDIPPATGTTNPFESLERTLAFSSQDWGAAGDFAWLYGIVLGWDGDSPDESVMAELAAKYEWSDLQVERLRALHRDFHAAATAYKCQTPEGAA